MKKKILPMALLAMACLLPTTIALGDDVVENEEGGVIQEIGDDGSTVEYLLDAEGRVIEIRHADGTVTRYWYDEDGQQHVVDDTP